MVAQARWVWPGGSKSAADAVSSEQLLVPGLPELSN